MIVSSIDIGTNTVILLIAEVDAPNRKIQSIYNEQRIPRIGKGLAKGGEITSNKIEELLQIIQDYKAIIEKYKCDRNYVIGTNALRIASNSKKITEEIKRKFDLNLEIIQGEDEAYLSFLGAIFNLDSASRNLVIDIGGGSTEIIYGTLKKLDFAKSTNIGVVSATEEFLLHTPSLKKEIEELNARLKELFTEFPSKDLIFDNAIAIAGTPTTLAAIKEKLDEFDEEKIEGHFLYKEELGNLIETLSTLSNDEIVKKYKAVVKGREDVILAGTIILHHLMNHFGIEKIKVSTKGIRYGKIVKELFSF